MMITLDLNRLNIYLECYLRFFLLVKANKDNFIDESNILSRHYVLTANSKIIRTRLCSKLTIKTPERRYLSSTLIIFHLVHHSINVFWINSWTCDKHLDKHLLTLKKFIATSRMAEIFWALKREFIIVAFAVVIGFFVVKRLLRFNNKNNLFTEFI